MTIVTKKESEGLVRRILEYIIANFRSRYTVYRLRTEPAGQKMTFEAVTEMGVFDTYSLDEKLAIIGENLSSERINEIFVEAIEPRVTELAHSGEVELPDRL